MRPRDLDRPRNADAKAMLVEIVERLLPIRLETGQRVSWSKVCYEIRANYPDAPKRYKTYNHYACDLLGWPIEDRIHD